MEELINKIRKRFCICKWEFACNEYFKKIKCLVEFKNKKMNIYSKRQVDFYNTELEIAKEEIINIINYLKINPDDI